ncbi:MAG: hypothetical protein WCK28_23130 [Burkholderiales bacterium]|jgi:hypothetical protein
MSIRPAHRVSDPLAAWIDSQLGDPEHEAPLTLGQVKRRMLRALETRGSLRDGALADPDVSWYDELGSLIDAFGEDAPAADFARRAPGVSLAELLEAMIDPEGPQASATLGDVRAALLEGGFTRLVDDGVLEPHDCDAVLSELDALAEDYGLDTPAAQLLGID